MPTYRYVNRNGFPIYLPEPRGGQVMFAPGHGSTASWFSRFCTKGKLTREVVEETAAPPSVVSITQQAPKIGVAAPIPRSPAPAASVPATPIVVKVGGMAAPAVPKVTFKDYETEYYAVKNGIFRCKCCTIFRTGSSASMNNHLAEYHAMVDGQVPAPQSDPSADRVVRTSRGEGEGMRLPPIKVVTGTPATQQATEGAVLPNMPANDAAPADTPPAPVASAAPERKAYTCEVGGCGKQFASADGLKRHTARVHATAPKE